MADKDDVQKLIDDAVAGLKSKNQELLDKLAKADKKAAPDNLDDLKARADKYDALKKKQDEETGEYKKLYSDLQKKYEKDTVKLKKEKAVVAADKESLQKNVVLFDSLREGGVMSDMSDIVASAIGPKMVKTDDGKYVVEDKPIGEYVKEWVKTDVGKRFVPNGNSGGGGKGGGGGDDGDNSRYFDKKSKDYSVTKQAAISRENPDEYRTLKKRFAGK